MQIPRDGRRAGRFGAAIAIHGIGSVCALHRGDSGAEIHGTRVI